MHLPKLGNNCTNATHLLLEEMEPFGEDYQHQRISDTLIVCGTNSRHFLVETNKIVMRLRMPRGQLSDQDSFVLRYSAISSRCGETILAVQGTLQTPSYPTGVRSPTHCIWRIVVPKGRRVRVEILDFDTGATNKSFHGRLTFANDHNMLSVIGRYQNNPPAEVLSTDNTMGIDAFLMPFSQHRGFKLRFSAYGNSECTTNLNLLSAGSMTYRRDSNGSNESTDVYCSYQLRPSQNATLLIEVLNYTTLSLLMSKTHFCSVLTPLKLIRPDQSEPLLSKLMCPGTTNRRALLPFPVDMAVSGTWRNGMTLLQLSFSALPCGGVWPLEPGDNMTITQPGQLDTDKAIDCAWAVGPDATVEDYLAPDDVQLEVSVSANLTGSCQDHYLLVYNGPDQNSPVMGRYCNQVTELNKVVERGLFVEYHAEPSAYSNHSSTFNVSVKYGSGCGGRLSYPYRQIEFIEQYKNNVECIWEIEAGPGFHVGLSFLNRFYIENSPDCTKDYLRVQQLRQNPGNANGNGSDLDLWTDLQTICGREPPKYINSTSSTMRLIFRSDGDITGDGFTAHFERNCGGILYVDPEPQILSSPGYPVSYGKNLYCNYTFVPRTTPSTGVLISFIKFDLERSPNLSCMFDNATITTRDNNKVETSVLCGVKQRHAYRAQQSITVLLRTDNSFSGKGFQLEYSSRLCGGIVNASQVVESPRQHQDEQMPHNSDCYWNLTAPEGHKFTIKFELLQMEAGHACDFDGVEVFASPVPDAKQRLARFCGHLTGELPTLHVSTHRALIHSYSDDSQASNGFKAVVRILPNCDERILLGEQNSSYIFNKYVGQYANNLDCSFVFIAPPGYYLSAEFRSFHVEASSNCSADSLQVRDGAGLFADDIGTFCGQDLPPKLTSSRHTLYMRFVTNERVTDTGFEVVVTAKPLACGNQLIRFDGMHAFELHSPVNDQGHYDNNVFCLWKIESEVQLHLQFLSLDLEGPGINGSCQADYLKLYSSEVSL